MKNIKDIKFKNFVPERLKIAYEVRGLDINKLSKELNICKYMLKAYLSGKIIPSKIRMNQISLVLDFPIKFFKKPLPNFYYKKTKIFFCENIEGEY
ncbi:MAG: hypothetical protein PVF17_00825 [Ignavibacteria bacterium]